MSNSNELASAGSAPDSVVRLDAIGAEVRIGVHFDVAARPAGPASVAARLPEAERPTTTLALLPGAAAPSLVASVAPGAQPTASRAFAGTSPSESAGTSPSESVLSAPDPARKAAPGTNAAMPAPPGDLGEFKTYF